mgnify:CR=1 FL=1|jgi:hypothetical protein
MSGLAERDTKEALVWVLHQPEDAAQRNALSGVMSVWTEQAPEAAAKFVRDDFRTENELLRQQLVWELRMKTDNSIQAKSYAFTT